MGPAGLKGCCEDSARMGRSSLVDMSLAAAAADALAAAFVAAHAASRNTFFLCSQLLLELVIQRRLLGLPATGKVSGNFHKNPTKKPESFRMQAWAVQRQASMRPLLLRPASCQEELGRCCSSNSSDGGQLPIPMHS